MVFSHPGVVGFTRIIRIGRNFPISGMSITADVVKGVATV